MSDYALRDAPSTRHSTAATLQPSLTGSRTMDFWLVGGAAILAWAPFYFFQQQSTYLDSVSASVPALALTLAYWINYPHFMASYKLAYGQGWKFISAHPLQLILVPLLMVALSLVALLAWDANIRDTIAIGIANTFFESIGLGSRMGRYPSLGSEILGLLVVLMYFTVGWHYAKQAFGCMMVYARFDRYRMTTWQRNLIRYSLLSTWWLTWLYSNCSVGAYNFYDLPVQRLGLPYILFQIAACLTTALLMATAFGVFVLNYVKRRQFPSATMCVPLVALLLWHVPLFASPHYFYLIALFHSLQYLPFVVKVEGGRFRRKKKRLATWLRMVPLYAALVVSGYLAFDGIPTSLDRATAAPTELSVSFFLIAFMVFINVHHYFIDNVLWRFNNTEVRELLFDEVPSTKTPRPDSH